MRTVILQLAIVFCFGCQEETTATEQDEMILKENDNEVIDQTAEYELVVGDLRIAWGMDWLPTGELIITEKSGEMYLFTENTGLSKIDGLPEVKVQGQGGLMDVKVHPDYQNNGWIYFTYASADGGGSGANTCLMRAKLQDNKLVSKEILYKGDPNTRSGNHFGSRIEFDRDGFVYFTIGDRGNRDLNPQDFYRDNGKVYRLKDDGSIPESNPFFSQSGAKKAIYSYGHRNPQGMAIHPETGEIWTHEHGPQGGDEINIIEAGKNYGWPVISYGINYDGSKFTDITEKEGMEQPLWYWVPSIAPSGMAFSSTDKYNDWKGDLFVGSLKFQYLMHCKIENNKVVSEEPLFRGIGRVRAVEEGPDGLIYFSVEGKGIYRMKPFNQ